MISETDIAWVAGLFEGEGCIALPHGRYVQLVIDMTDRDVLERLDALFPSPSGTRSRKVAKGKEGYAWRLSKREEERAQEAFAILDAQRGSGNYNRAQDA